MKINLKEYFKLSVIYTLLAAFPPILQIIIRPIIEGNSRLSVDEFSRLSITELIITLAFTLVMFSMNNAIARFHYDYKDDQRKHNRMVSSIFTTILFRGVILIGITFIIGPFIGKLFLQPELLDFSTYGYAAVITGINRAIVLTAASLYRNQKKVWLFVIAMLSWGLIRTLFQLFALFYVDMSFIGYVNGNCFGSIIISLAILIYVYRKTGFAFDRELLKPIFEFARPLFHYSIIYWAITFIDRLFLVDSPIELGIYDTAISFAFGIQMILQGIQGASQPEIYRLMSDGIKKNIEGIKQYSNLLMAQTELIIALMIIPAMLYLNLFFETELMFASQLIGIIFIKFIMRTQFIIFSYPIYFLKKTKAFLYINLFVLVITLVANYFLIPIFGIYGAIMAGLIAFFLQAVITYQYQQKLVEIKWNLMKVLYLPLGTVCIAIILELLKYKFQLDQYLISGILTASIIMALIILYRQEIKKYLPLKF